jgi:poly [ADP-ribose] polymerase 10/14/15
LHSDIVALGGLPVLPEDLNHEGENLLPTYKGQVIQVSKVHPDGEWLFGNVLDDPLLNDAKVKDHQKTTRLDTMLAHALHDRAMSGWFPKCVAEPADHCVMQRLIRTIGGEGLDGLMPPDEWTSEAKDSSVYAEGRIDVPFTSNEYNKVFSAFTERLYGQKRKIMVTQIERIQNLPLWQSYAVKKQSIKQQYAENQHHRMNNNGDVERQLFHGTHPDIIRKIEKQGFNRSFAGRNAVRYGKGVYFARDSAYSCHKAYSSEDEHGIQHMLVCQVVVGDWDKGENEQLVPDSKPGNPFELYDTTVDNVTNPSIFVVYHDSQCYPSYLVSFKSD